MQTGGEAGFERGRDAESAPLLSQHRGHGLHPPPHALPGDGGVPAEVVPMHRGYREEKAGGLAKMQALVLVVLAVITQRLSRLAHRCPVAEDVLRRIQVSYSRP